MITFVISTDEITHTQEDYGGRKYYYCKDADIDAFWEQQTKEEEI